MTQPMIVGISILVIGIVLLIVAIVGKAEVIAHLIALSVAETGAMFFTMALFPPGAARTAAVAFFAVSIGLTFILLLKARRKARAGSNSP